jgi:hypothetical protein
MFGPVTCLVMRQLIEMAKYTHLRSLEGQDLRYEHTHIYLSFCGACLPSPNLGAGCSECPTFSPSQPPAATSPARPESAKTDSPPRDAPFHGQGRRRARTGGGTHRTSWGRSPIQWILANGKTPPVLPTSEGLLFNVEDSCELRTKHGKGRVSARRGLGG